MLFPDMPSHTQPVPAQSHHHLAAAADVSTLQIPVPEAYDQSAPEAVCFEKPRHLRLLYYSRSVL